MELLWKRLNVKSEQILKFKNQIFVSRNSQAMISKSSAVVILAEWEEFKKYDWNSIIKKTKVFDGRNIIKAHYNIGK